MRFLTCLFTLFSAVVVVRAAPGQVVLAQAADDAAFQVAEGHFSVWARETKSHFLHDLASTPANASLDWVIVMGNEAGDLDSLTSAHLWAFHLSHLRHPQQAVALLQTERDALDLRPENKLALERALMAPGHRDLLTIDELPFPPPVVATMVKGIVLVDANEPRKGIWDQAKVLSIFDHHRDQRQYLDAKPRIIEPVASTCSVVALEVLRSSHHNWHGKSLPHELGDLVLSTIATDSKAFSKGNEVDYKAARKIQRYSSYSGYKLQYIMSKLSKRFRKARKDLHGMGVRDLLRRDWKSQLVESADLNDDLAVHLGFASVPISLDELVTRTSNASTAEFVEIESRWTNEIHADISVVLTSYKDEEDNKHREIFLAVRHDKRLDTRSAESLYQHVVAALEQAPDLDLSPWPSKHASARGHLGERRKAFRNGVSTAGRKIVRPIVDDAVKQWLDSQ